MKRIIKKIGGERIGSGKKMTVAASGYGYSTHDVSQVMRTSMSFGTIVPMATWILPTGSRLRLRLDALINSNALLYQLYGSAKFQVDVFSARMALYNPKMLLNLNDQGYDIADIQFPLMELTTNAIDASLTDISNQQINTSALLRYLGVSANGINSVSPTDPVTRRYMAMYLIMYYQTIKEYYANKQEKRGFMIHNVLQSGIIGSVIADNATAILEYPAVLAPPFDVEAGSTIDVYSLTGEEPDFTRFYVYSDLGNKRTIRSLFTDEIALPGGRWTFSQPVTTNFNMVSWSYDDPRLQEIQLVEYDLKAIDRMMMELMKNVDSANPLIINDTTELPFGASFQEAGGYRSINGSQEGLCVKCYQSDVMNNWLDNATVNALNNKSKVKVDVNGEFTIDSLNITQKLYNYDMRIGVTDGTLEEWREMTYGEVGKSKSLKPVFEGGLVKEVVFDMVVSTASTIDEPLGSIASRGQFGNKHKGGYAQIDTDEEKLVMVLASITPRLVYNQGNDWEVNLKTLDDLHKPVLDKIGYQNLLTDQMAAAETKVDPVTGVLTTYSAGKQPAWQWYRTNYDRALGNMADTESYKVFGREYEFEDITTGTIRIKDLTTYIDPRKFNDVFAIESLDAMNFDVQVGIDATLTLVMSEEVIPTL